MCGASAVSRTVSALPYFRICRLDLGTQGDEFVVGFMAQALHLAQLRVRSEVHLLHPNLPRNNTHDTPPSCVYHTRHRICWKVRADTCHAIGCDTCMLSAQPYVHRAWLTFRLPQLARTADTGSFSVPQAQCKARPTARSCRGMHERAHDRIVIILLFIIVLLVV